jgi:inner membrane protein
MENNTKNDVLQFVSANNVTLSKMTTIGLLVLLLLVPLYLINSLLAERKERRDQAVANITTGWGREQVIIGPILILPAAVHALRVRHFHG